MTPERHGAGVRRAGPIAGAARTGARVLRRVSHRPIPTGSSRSIRSCAARPIRGSCRRRSRSRTAPCAAPRRNGSGKSCSIASELTRRVGGDGQARRPRRRSRSAWLAQKIAGSVAEGTARSLRDGALRAGRVPEHRGRRRDVEALVALGGYRRYHAILLTLDRMEITSPRVYARTVEAARRIDDDLSGRDERHAVIAFQAALGDPRARAAHARDRRRRRRRSWSCRSTTWSIRRPGRAKRDRALSRRSRSGSPRRCSMRCRRSCSPISGRRRRRRMSRGCCRRWPDRRRTPNAPTMKWEGLDYRIDLFAAEHASARSAFASRSNRPDSMRRSPAGDPEKIAECVADVDLRAGARRS